MPDPSPPVAALAGWLLTYLLHSTVLLAGAWALTARGWFRPTTTEYLWKAALLAGVVTSLGVSGVVDDGRLVVLDGLATETVEIALRDGGAFSPPVGSATGHRPAWAKTVVRRIEWEAGVAGPAGAPNPGPRFAAYGEEWLPVPVGWLVGGWLGGALLFLLILSWRAWRLRDVYRSLRPPSVRARRALAHLVREACMASSPCLRTSSLVASPCALPGGIIVLSVRCEDDLSDAELRAVLAHELSHLRRRDPIWTGVLRGLGSVLWLQPINRLAIREVRRASELICDDWALDRTGERMGLATSIFRVANWSVGEPAHGAAMTGQNPGGASERVRRILDGGPSRAEPRWLRFAAGVALFIPLYWLPTVRLPATLHATVLVDRREVRVEGRDTVDARTSVEIIELRVLPDGARRMVLGPRRPS